MMGFLNRFLDRMERRYRRYFGIPEPKPDTSRRCPVCNGNGVLDSGDVCPNCSGRGREDFPEWNPPR